LDKIKDPLGMSASRLELDAYIITAQSTVVSNIVKSINKAGIKLNKIVFQPVGAAKASLDVGEMEMGTALIDIGEEISDISVFKHGNIVYTSNVKIGGNSITNDISICLKLPYSEAEMLKIKYGKLRNDQKTDYKIKVNASYDNIVEIDHNRLLEIMEARVEEIFELIKQNLKKSGHYDEISGIVLIGGGIALFNGICDFSSKILDKPVRTGSPEYVGVANPSYVSAVGIVLDSEILYDEKKKFTENITENGKDMDWRQIASKDNKGNNKNVVSRIKNFFTEFF
jgi:cell division protein FtsA